MLYALITNTFIRIPSNEIKVFYYFGFCFLLLFGAYGLSVLKKSDKLCYWPNDFTKEKNLELLNYISSELLRKPIKLENNYTYFVYKKSWWRMPYDIYLFADQNLIVISVDGFDIYDGGFIDFGASKRTQNRILKMMKEKACH